MPAVVPGAGASLSPGFGRLLVVVEMPAWRGERVALHRASGLPPIFTLDETGTKAESCKHDDPKQHG